MAQKSMKIGPRPLGGQRSPLDVSFGISVNRNKGGPGPPRQSTSGVGGRGGGSCWAAFGGFGAFWVVKVGPRPFGPSETLWIAL